MNGIATSPDYSRGAPHAACPDGAASLPKNEGRPPAQGTMIVIATGAVLPNALFSLNHEVTMTAIVPAGQSIPLDRHWTMLTSLADPLYSANTTGTMVARSSLTLGVMQNWPQ